jgi:type II secretory pathway pseudopilin PulG
MSQQINLILPELRPRFDWLALPLVAAVALAGIVLVALLAQFQAFRHGQLSSEAAAVNGQLLNLQQQVQTLAQAVGARKPNTALPEQIGQLRSGVVQRREVLDFIGRRQGTVNPQGFAAMLDGFSRQTLDGAWLVGFILAPEEIEIRGRLLDPALLPRYISRLNEDPAFAGRRFAALEMTGVVPALPKAGSTESKPVMPARPFTEFVLRTDKVPGGEKRP